MHSDSKYEVVVSASDGTLGDTQAIPSPSPT